MRSSFEVDSKKTEWDALLLSGSQVRQNAYTQQEESAGGSVTAKWVNKGIVGAALGLLLVASLVLLVGVEDMNTSKGISVDKKVALSCPSGYGNQANPHTCIPCQQVGVYSRFISAGHRECRKCPSGTASPGLVDSCEYCGSGQGQISAGLNAPNTGTECIACKAGEYSAKSPAGHLSAVNTPMITRKCLPCPRGQASSNNSDSCQLCTTPGMGIDPSSRACVDCKSQNLVSKLIPVGNGRECVACPMHSVPDPSTGTSCQCATGYKNMQEYTSCVPNGCVGSVLHAGVFLWQKHYLMSPNQRFTLDMQEDGKLLIYVYNAAHTSRKMWKLWYAQAHFVHSGPGWHLVMQGDGNLALYGAGYAHWSTRTSGHNNRLVLQNDGNLVMYNAANHAVWASGTGCANNFKCPLVFDDDLMDVSK